MSKVTYQKGVKPMIKVSSKLDISYLFDFYTTYLKLPKQIKEKLSINFKNIDFLTILNNKFKEVEQQDSIVKNIKMSEKMFELIDISTNDILDGKSLWTAKIEIDNNQKGCIIFSS